MEMMPLSGTTRTSRSSVVFIDMTVDLSVCVVMHRPSFSLDRTSDQLAARTEPPTFLSAAVTCRQSWLPPVCRVPESVISPPKCFASGTVPKVRCSDPTKNADVFPRRSFSDADACKLRRRGHIKHESEKNTCVDMIRNYHSSLLNVQ